MAFDRSAVLGMSAVRDAFKAIEPTFRDKIADATEETARVIQSQAILRVRRRYGILAEHIQMSMSRATGVAKVGIGPRESVPVPHVGRNRKPAVEISTHIAHLVEFGHGGPHGAPAYPFMIPAAEGEQENYVRRCHDAGAEAENAIAATGGGLL